MVGVSAAPLVHCCSLGDPPRWPVRVGGSVFNRGPPQLQGKVARRSHLALLGLGLPLAVSLPGGPQHRWWHVPPTSLCRDREAGAGPGVGAFDQQPFPAPTIPEASPEGIDRLARDSGQDWASVSRLEAAGCGRPAAVWASTRSTELCRKVGVSTGCGSSQPGRPGTRGSWLLCCGVRAPRPGRAAETPQAGSISRLFCGRIVLFSLLCFPQIYSTP